MSESHRFQLERPGRHGTNSLTGTCTCHQWSTTVFPHDNQPTTQQASETRLRAYYDAHVNEEKETLSLIHRVQEQAPRPHGQTSFHPKNVKP